MAARVPLLVTMDLELAPDYELAEQAAVLEQLHRDCERIGLPTTVFTTSDAARTFPLELSKLRSSGHEIGCHGRDHSAGDDFSRMSLDEARAALSQSTEAIERMVGVRPRCFRGPWLTTSAATQRALVELGYRADFSPCPQRLDFFRTRGGDWRWLFAPRGPYRPASDSPFRRGDSPLWVVPLSCLGAPFLSGVGYLVGTRGARAMFRALLAEARRTGRPIVYLFHSYELCARADGVAERRPWLQRRYAADPRERYRRNLALLESMLATDGIEPVTGESLLGSLS